jgi:hypothetical protein
MSLTLKEAKLEQNDCSHKLAEQVPALYKHIQVPHLLDVFTTKYLTNHKPKKVADPSNMVLINQVKTGEHSQITNERSNEFTTT